MKSIGGSVFNVSFTMMGCVEEMGFIEVWIMSLPFLRGKIVLLLLLIVG